MIYINLLYLFFSYEQPNNIRIKMLHTKVAFQKQIKKMDYDLEEL